jgi:uncharacterized protein
MNRDETIGIIEEFVKQNLKDYDSGHDWWHIERVRRLAQFINNIETGADPFTLEVAALLHDSADSKFAGDDIESGYAKIGDLLDETGLSGIKQNVIEVIRNVSFSKKESSGNLSDQVLLILQDADRLDAIGAIGVARAFNYGGFRDNPIYLPDEKTEGRSKSTIGHFYDKLLKLKDMMNTVTGRKIAEERHLYLEKFLEQFFKEWEFGRGIRNI